MYIYYLAISHNHDFFSVIIRGGIPNCGKKLTILRNNVRIVRFFLFAFLVFLTTTTKQPNCLERVNNDWLKVCVCGCVCVCVCVCGGGLIWQKYHHNFFNDFIMILCYVGFTILFEHYRQTNFPYYKDKSFKREQNIKNNGENNGGYLGQSGRS